MIDPRTRDQDLSQSEFKEENQDKVKTEMRTRVSSIRTRKEENLNPYSIRLNSPGSESGTETKEENHDPGFMDQ